MKNISKINYQKFILSKRINYKKYRNTKKILYKIIDNLDKPQSFFHSLSRKFSYNFNLKDFKKYKKFKNIVLIGMGGSVIGSEAIYKFLQEKIKKNFIFLNNIDETKLKKIKKENKTNNTLFIIISKSGSTVETITNFLALKIIKKRSKNILIITEKNNNLLHSLAKKMELPIIEHKHYIGGRFSVLSEVGMLPAFLMGLSIKRIRNNLLIPLKNSNINFLIKNIIKLSTLLENRKINNLVFCNFIPELDGFLSWSQQLIAESLGKNGKGFLPTISTAPKDHHSLLQLYLDGPKDKLFYIFSFSKNKKTSYKLNPRIFDKKFDFLKKKNISQIKIAQKKAFLTILKKKKIPFRELVIKDKTEETIGELLSLFMIEIAIVGKTININPFNQPAVEELKVVTKKILTSKNTKNNF